MRSKNVLDAGKNIDRPDRTTLTAFALLILVGGSNAVAVRFSNFELPPFWGAAIRFGAAALIFWLIVFVRRFRVPRGRALMGLLLYGLLSVGISYALLYWALLRIQAGFTMVVLALGPLMTLILALLHGLERFRLRSFVGAGIAIAGILLAVGRGLGTDVHLPSLLGIVLAVACISEGSVIYKLLPAAHPVTTNAVAATIGALFLLAGSLIAGEPWSLPATFNTWASFVYLVLIGSVGLFYLYLFVLSRWTASATNYSFLLFPIVTVFMGGWLLGEQITPALVIGGTVVLLGVWVGAFGQSGRRKAAGTDQVRGKGAVSAD